MQQRRNPGCNNGCTLAPNLAAPKVQQRVHPELQERRETERCWRVQGRRGGRRCADFPANFSVANPAHVQRQVRFTLRASLHKSMSPGSTSPTQHPLTCDAMHDATSKWIRAPRGAGGDERAHGLDPPLRCTSLHSYTPTRGRSVHSVETAIHVKITAMDTKSVETWIKLRKHVSSAT